MHVAQIGRPHQWCGRLHRASFALWITLLVLCMLFAATRGGASYWLLLAVSLAIGVALGAVLVVHHGRVARQQISAVETGERARLRVRPGWARLALATDAALIVLYVGASVTMGAAVLWWEGDSSDVSWAPDLRLIGALVALTLVDHVAHLRGVAVEDARVAGSPGVPADAGSSE